MTYTPPTCPHCGEPLTEVSESYCDRYQFNEETGKYEESYLGETDTYCGSCGTELPSGMFPDGACNYHADKQGD